MKYRKRPIVIEAVRWEPWRIQGCAQWIPLALPEAWFADHWVFSEQDGSIFIDTLEGEMRAKPGDWIIRGTAGDFCACRADVFEKTYEVAE